MLKAGEVKVLQVRGAVDVRLTPGPASIEIQAPVASLAAVETTFAAGTLVITNRGTNDKGAGVVVLLQLPTIVDVIAGDASRVTLKVPDCPAGACPRLALTVTGAARVRAEGRVQQLVIDARGAGQVRLGALSAITGQVKVAGAAGVRLGDLKTLTIKGSGVGRVRYRGNPVVESNVAPSVRVERSRP